jgi:hypothetical protein
VWGETALGLRAVAAQDKNPKPSGNKSCRLILMPAAKVNDLAANHEARTTEKPALLPPYTIGRVRIRSSLDMKLGQNRGGDVEQIEITRRDTDTHQDTRANSASHPSARFAGDDQGRRPAIAIALPRLQGRPLVRVPIAPVYPGPVPQRNKFSISEFE